MVTTKENQKCTMKMRQENKCTCNTKITKCELNLMLKQVRTLVQTTFKSVNFRCLIRSNRDLKQWHNIMSASFLNSNWFGRKV
jgi:hypothetical protein